MGYIYKITNDINDKVYVGQTQNSLNDRFSKHKYKAKECYFKQNYKQPLYNAINKYGFEHFKIELIEECNNNDLSTREKYWINYYNSYEHGYNATIGGEGVTQYNYEEIYHELLNHNLSCAEIADKFGCCLQTIYNVAHSYNINLYENHPNKNFHNNYSISLQKPVEQYDKNNNYIQSFDSINAASRWVYENTNCPTLISAKNSIRRNCNKPYTNKSAYGYIWKFKK